MNVEKIKFAYIVHKLYSKFNLDSLYINVELDQMCNVLLNNTDNIIQKISLFKSLNPLPIVLDKSISNPSKPEEYYLILTLLPFVFLQTFNYTKNNDIKLNRIIDILDTSQKPIYEIMVYLFQFSEFNILFSLNFSQFNEIQKSYNYDFSKLYKELIGKLDGKFDLY